jgi:hypothetical protein
MKRLLALAFLVAALSVCAGQPVRYAPTGAAAQPLHVAALPPLTLDDVVDEAGRGQIFSHHAGGAVNAAIGADGRPVDTDVAWAGAVRDALALELARLGWPASPNGTPGAARLKATVVAARADYHAGMGVHADGKLLIEVVLTEADGREVWQGPLEGSGGGTIGAAGAPENGIRQAWNAALGDSISRLGPLLSKDRPWEFLGKGRAAETPNAPPADAWWKK